MENNRKNVGGLYITIMEFYIETWPHDFQEDYNTRLTISLYKCNILQFDLLFFNF